MRAFGILIIVLALLGVLGVLVMGIAGLFRGQSPQRQNKLMQYRVLLQFVALGLMALFVLLLKN
jgi:hypothetical protein